MFAVLAHAPDAGAQSSPVLASEAMYSTGSLPQCGGGMGLVSSAAYRGGAISLRPAPVTRLRNTRSDAQGVGGGLITASLGTPDRFAWGLQAGGNIGRGSNLCAMSASSAGTHNRTWATLSRRFGTAENGGGVALSVGERSVAAFDPARDLAGLTLGVWRSMRGARLGFDVRRHTGSATATTFSERTNREFGREIRSDTMPGRVDTIWNSRQVTDTGTSRIPWSALDVRTRFQMSLGRLALDFTVGGTTGSRGGSGTRSPSADTLAAGAETGNRLATRMWGRADARVALTSFIDVVGGISSLPEQAFGSDLSGSVRGRSTAPRRVVTFGMGISGMPRRSRTRGQLDSAGTSTSRDRDGLSAGAARVRFEAVRDDAAMVRVRVHLPAAKRVDFTSEITGWTPVAMQQVGDGWWEVPVRAPSGTYRMNIRIDEGGWSAPPGVPTVGDEFGGKVGLVAIG
ncbi:MAG: hypothetical protein V4617_01400 [Gemmatimonadota bacterium]